MTFADLFKISKHQWYDLYGGNEGNTSLNSCWIINWVIIPSKFWTMPWKMIILLKWDYI